MIEELKIPHERQDGGIFILDGLNERKTNHP